MQKISSITLRNFKFFYGIESTHKHNKLELSGDNLLMYGENGSGKSSLYWAIYTFLQSCLKSDIAQIEKYFKHDHQENLRNRFANDADDSGIIIQFVDSVTGGKSTEETASWNITTHNSSKIKQSLVGSDFINYKYLSKFYDFRNSEQIDLFDLFVKNVFMFIDFNEPYKQHNGTPSTSTYASDWWRFISEEYSTLPKNKNKVSERSPAYLTFQNETIPRFVGLLKSFLLDVTSEANRLLKDDFNESFTVKFDVDSIVCAFNKRVPGKAKQKDGELHKPTIPLHVHFNHDLFASGLELIEKPHTFLNEARLTAIALSIAFLIKKYFWKKPKAKKACGSDDGCGCH